MMDTFVIQDDFLIKSDEIISNLSMDEDISSDDSSTENLNFNEFWDDLFNSNNIQSTIKETPSTSNSTLLGENSQLNLKKNFKNTPKNLASNTQWSDLNLSRQLIKVLSELGFNYPTLIQAQIIPIALQGMDILATAETGSGKTAAFLLPILEKLLRNPFVQLRHKSSSSKYIHITASRALILLPTRELAIQCFEVLEKLSIYTKITKSLVTGGLSLKNQEIELRNQPDIIIATPGRILDILMNSQSIHLDLLQTIIFDEADRLMELGFKEDCNEIISLCSSDRQTLLFSATLTEKTAELAKFTLKNPINITINTSHKVTQTLEQEFVEVEDDSHKEPALLHFCSTFSNKKTIIFLQTKKAVRRLGIIFKLLGITCSELYGDLTQTQRLESLNSFKEPDSNFLLSTELASRGLDIEGVETVINFEIPLDISRYIHRVGRTARMGNDGKAVTLFTSNQYKEVKKMAKSVINNSDLQSKNIGFFKRKIPTSKLNEWKQKIIKFEDSINYKLEQEKIENEILIAKNKIKKMENMNKYKDIIQSRPPRIWHLNSKEKLLINKKSILKGSKKIQSELISKQNKKNNKYKTTLKPKKNNNTKDKNMKASKKLNTKKSTFQNTVKENTGLKHSNYKPTHNKSKQRNNTFKSKKRYKRRNI